MAEPTHDRAWTERLAPWKSFIFGIQAPEPMPPKVTLCPALHESPGILIVQSRSEPKRGPTPGRGASQYPPCFEKACTGKGAETRSIVGFFDESWKPHGRIGGNQRETLGREHCPRETIHFCEELWGFNAAKMKPEA